MYARLVHLFMNIVSPDDAKPIVFKAAPEEPKGPTQVVVPTEPTPLFPNWKQSGENSHVGSLVLNPAPVKTEELYGKHPLISIGLLSEIRHANVVDGEAPWGATLHHREALRGVRSAIAEWNDTSDRNLKLIVCLGNLIESSRDTQTAQHNLIEVVSELDKCRIPTHYVLGNHDVYNIPGSLLQTTLRLPNDTKAYYWLDIHAGFRLVVLDCLDLSVARWGPDHANTTQAVSLLRKYNKNRNMNEVHGLEGLEQRFNATNGGISQDQLLWLSQVLQDTANKGKKAIICMHMPIYPEVAEPSCLLWNYDEVLRTIHSGRNMGCVALVLSGHDRGGCVRDPAGVHHVVVEGIVECCPPLTAFGVLELYENKITLRGESTMSSYTIRL